MDTTTLDTRDDERWDDYHDESAEEALPVRPRRKFLNATTALLLCAITAAGGFYAGVRVEKNQTTSSSAPSGAGGLPSGIGGGSAGASSFASRLRSLFSAGAPGGAPSGAAAFAARLGNAGTVSSVNGKTINLSEASGNTVTVKLDPVTKISKSQSVSRHAIRPGDMIAVQGATQPNGSIVATAVTDSGNNSTTAPSSGGGGGGGGGGLSSLFNSGG